VELAGGQGSVDGISEVASLGGDADEHGVPVPDAYVPREVRNPMPHAGAFVSVAGTEITFGPQLPSSWLAVALEAANGDAGVADASLRSIKPEEGLVLSVVRDHRPLLFLDEKGLRELLRVPVDAERLFVIEDPDLPNIYADRPPSKATAWPLMCEALRRRVRLDPTKVPRRDVLRERLRREDRRSRDDGFWPEMPPCAPVRALTVGASAFAEEALARGWPHGVRLLHQHPHNDSAGPVFDWIIAQPELVLRSYWAREIAVRFVRYAGGDPDARSKGWWVHPLEAKRIFGDVLAGHGPALTARGGEAVTLLLEALVGGQELLKLAHAVLVKVGDAGRAEATPVSFAAVLALGWVARRGASPRVRTAVAALEALAPTKAGAQGLDRALDLAFKGREGAARSARTPDEWLLSGDREAIRTAAAGGTGEIGLDIQWALALGDDAVARWEGRAVPEGDRVWFADELALLASPRAQALATKLRG
jgi:hypothetical protein